MEKVGQQPIAIGRYDVERLLGQGGMGRVWLARDTVLGRHVAIKVLRDDLALPPSVRNELVLRMRHEAQAAAAVSHPNIVTLHDMGEDEEVGLFLVFEFVPGADGKTPESLRDRLKRGPLSLAELARLARELGAALSFAHEAKVIHRDIKPENVLFSRTGAKIADFGIARIPDSTLTRANTVLGTPAYTAPEALSKGDFGPLSDQFSLATTLYEAATGARAFAGDDAIATAGKVSNDAPAPLSDLLGAEHVVRALDDVLRRGLAKEPELRFASCLDFGEALSRAVETKSPSPEIIELERTPLSSRVQLEKRRASDRPSPSDTPRPSILVRRETHRFQNIAAAIAVIVIIVLILVGRRASPPAEEPENPSTRETVRSAQLPLGASAPSPNVAPPRHPPRPKVSHDASAPVDGGATGPSDGGVATNTDASATPNDE